MSLASHLPVKRYQENIAEQGRDNPALGSPALCGKEPPLAVASRLEHRPDQSKHSVIGHALGHLREEFFVIHRPETRIAKGFWPPRKRYHTELRAGLYARVSPHDQQTIPLQTRAMREQAARRGWSVVTQVKGIGSGPSQREKREKLLEASSAPPNRHKDAGSEEK